MNARENYDGQSIVVVVTAMLQNRNRELASRFQERFPIVKGESTADQIRRLNRFWRIELGLANPVTISARECLMDDCDSSRWVILFREQVLPVIVNLGLPRGTGR